jgi:hypothetical protein
VNQGGAADRCGVETAAAIRSVLTESCKVRTIPLSIQCDIGDSRNSERSFVHIVHKFLIGLEI